MEKVQTKNNNRGVFALFATLALALGVGVSLAPKEVSRITAAPGDVATTADFTKATTGSTSYKTAFTYGDWSLFGAANNNKAWAFMKFGGKSADIGSANPSYVRGQIKNVGVSSVNVVFNAGNLSVGSVNSWGLKAYSDNTYAANKQIASALGGAMTAQTAQTLTLTPASPVPANSYYEVYFNLANTTKTNGVVWVDKIQFIEASSEQGPDPESLSLDVEDLTLDILDTHELAPSFEPEGASAGVSYSVTQSNPSGVVSVTAAGVVTALKTGNATITATTTDGSNLSATVNVTVTVNYSSSVLTPAQTQELATGADVLVRGKVVADIKNGGAYAIQVGDRGIMTYGINDLTIGNDYIIAAKMAAYQGMPQISNATSVVDMGPSTTTVTPKVISSVSELTAKLSGTLVQINNAKYKSGTFSTSAASNVTLTLASTDLVIRATKDVPNAAINAANSIFSSTGPDDVLNVTTVAGWFNGAQLLFSEETVIQKIVPAFGTLDRILLTTTNVVTSYYVGETFSLSGLVVIAYNAVNLAKIVTAEATSSLASGYTFVAVDIGSKTITISYEEGDVEKTATFDITVAAAPAWTKATMSYTGSSTGNMSTSNNAATVGLNSTLFNVQANKGPEGQQNNVGLNKDGTIRLYWHADGGNILTVSIASGKEISKLVFNFGGTVAKARIMVDSEEKYNAEPSSSGSVTLENLKGSSFSIENANTSSKQIWISSVEIYYANASNPVYDEAKVFADYIMAFDGGDAQGMSDSFATCEDNLLDAMIEWEELSAEAKDLFETHTDFASARKRLLNWLFANGFDSLDDLDVDGPGLVSKNKDSNSLTATIIIGVIGLTTLAGYYFLKRKKAEKN